MPDTISISQNELLKLKAGFLQSVELIDKILLNNQSDVSTSDSRKGTNKKPVPADAIDSILEKRNKKFFNRKK